MTLYRPVIFVDYYNKYYIENLLLNNMGYNRPRTLDFLAGRIDLSSYLKFAPCKKTKFAFIECLIEDDIEIQLVRKFADRFGLDVLICNNSIELEYRKKEFSIKQILKTAGNDLRSSIRNQLHDGAGLFITNRMVSDVMCFNKESSITHINSIVLDIDHDFEDYAYRIYEFIRKDVGIPNSMRLYRTATNRMRIYIDIKTEPKDSRLAKTVYNHMNLILEQEFGIGIDMSFKRLSQQIWLENFRVLKKEGKKSHLECENIEDEGKWYSLGLLYDSIGKYSYPYSGNARETKGKSQSGNAEPDYGVQCDLNDSKIYNRLKRMMLGRFVVLSDALRYGYRDVVLTLVGNCKYLVDELRKVGADDDFIGQIFEVTKSVVGLIRDHSTSGSDSCFGGKTFEEICSNVGSLPFKFNLNPDKHEYKSYHHTMMELISILSSHSLRQACNVKMSEDGRTVTISANRIEKIFGISHSSICNILDRLEDGGFCVRRRSSFSGNTYEFIDKIDLELILERATVEAIFGGEKLTLSSADIRPFHRKIIEYLVSISRKVRFMKYINRIYERFRSHFDDDARVDSIFKKLYYRVEPRYG